MNVFKRFSKYLFPYWKHIAGTLLCTGIFVLFSGAAYWLAGSFLQVLFNGEVLDSNFVSDDSINAKLKVITSWLVSGETHFATLFRTSIAIVLAFLGKNLFSYLSLYYVSFVEQRVIKDLRDDLFNRFLMQDLSFFHDQRRGNLMSTLLNDVQQLNTALNKSFTKIIRDPINALLLFILLLTVSVKLTLAALVIIPVFGWIILVLGKYIKIYSVRVQEAMSRVTSHLQETLAGVRVVKAFASESFESDRFNIVSGDQYSNSIKRERLKRMVIPINEFVGILIFCGILYVGGEQVLVNQNIGSDDFIRFLVLLFGLLTPIMSMSNLVASIRMAEASGERVFQMMDTRPGLSEKPDAKSIKNFDKAIEFNNVSFSYNSVDDNVLSNLNITIKPSDKLAVVGKSGSGKSTFLNLLPRFYDVKTGEILFDDNNIQNLKIADLRNLFGIVTQNIVLFHDTIASNIAYGVPEASIHQIEEAAKSAFAHDFIASFPDGYNTLVGEQGSLLSGGQRQRISIARAFIRNPQIVIMDEATSALDPESEEAVSAAIEKLKSGRTIIMVTHRLAAVREFDKVLVLDDGRVIDSGNHEELLERCDVYRMLAKQQKLIN